MARGRMSSERMPTPRTPRPRTPTGVRARPRVAVGTAGQPAARAAGAGSGWVHVRAVGVYVVDDQGVHWRPAFDLNRAVLGGQVVAALAVLALARVLRRRH
jgi:hypothetical protein